MAGAINWLWLQVRRHESEHRVVVSDTAASEINRRGAGGNTNNSNSIFGQKKDSSRQNYIHIRTGSSCSGGGGADSTEWVVLPPNTEPTQNPTTPRISSRSLSSLSHLGASCDSDLKIPDTEEMITRMRALEPTYRECHARVQSRPTSLASSVSSPTPFGDANEEHTAGGDTHAVASQNRVATANTKPDMQASNNPCLDFFSAVLND